MDFYKNYKGYSSYVIYKGSLPIRITNCHECPTDFYIKTNFKAISTLCKESKDTPYHGQVNLFKSKPKVIKKTNFMGGCENKKKIKVYCEKNLRIVVPNGVYAR